MTSRKLRLFFLLFFVLVLSLALRIYLLNKIPNSISGDEASLGYNAYSILKTGKDEFGYKLPLYFRSFDDYKNPVFGYILVPFIGALGLNEWSIRLPSVFTGFGVVLLFFLITKELTKNNKLSLLTSFTAAISPWLIYYSRVAIEIETALFLSLLGIYLFLKGKNNNLFYVFSFIIFGIAFYTYHSNKLWLALFIPVLLIINKKFNKFIALGVLLLLLIAFPYLGLLSSSKIALRPYAISIFADKGPSYSDAQLIAGDQQNKFIGGQLVHNRRFTYINQALKGYLMILNPQILFDSIQLGNTRLVYLWQIPFMLLTLLTISANPQLLLIFLTWLILGFLPGALTWLPVYDRRIIINSYPIIFFTCYGIVYFLSKTHNKLKKVFSIMFTFVISISFFFYAHNFYLHGQKEVIELWGNGMKELVFNTEKYQDKYKRIIVSRSLNEPLTYFLFYKKYSPQLYISQGGTKSGGYLEEGKMGKYSFKEITSKDWDLSTLYVWKYENPVSCFRILQTVYLTNGRPLANIGTYDPIFTKCK